MTNSLWSWVCALTATGAQVTVFYDAVYPQGAKWPAPVVPVPHLGQGAARVPTGLGQRLSGSDCLVLSSAWSPANWVAASLTGRLGLKYVAVPHGAYNPSLDGHSTRLKRVAGLLESRFLESAHFVHVFFEKERAFVQRVAPRARVAAIPTGMNLGSVDDSWHGGSYIAWLGRYDIEHKGLDLLLKSLSKLEESQCPNVRLHGRDSRDSRSDVVNMVRRFGLEGRVCVLGPIDGQQKTEFLASCAGFVMPSRWESHSMALAEAMAMGVPCLVNRGLPSEVELERSGAARLGVAGTDGFATLLGQLGAGEQRGHWSMRSRRFVEEHLNWSHASREFIESVGSCDPDRRGTKSEGTSAVGGSSS